MHGWQPVSLLATITVLLPGHGGGGAISALDLGGGAFSAREQLRRPHAWRKHQTRPGGARVRSCRSTPTRAAASYLQRSGHMYSYPTSVIDPQASVTQEELLDALRIRRVNQHEPRRQVPYYFLLLAGTAFGMLLSAVAVAVGCGPWQVRKTEAVEVNHTDKNFNEPGPEIAPLGLSGGQLQLPYICYNDAYFRQFSWSPERERDTMSVLDASGREVARSLGRLMATPNGEMYAETEGSTWAVLKRPAPSRRPGQLWDFKVCARDGLPYAEVRQMSETKCVVDCVSSQRKLMTVVGNFTYPVFLSGERNIHVWVQQDTHFAQPGLGAQVEATLQSRSVMAEAQTNSGGSSSSAEPPTCAKPLKDIGKECQEKQARTHRFHVTTTAGIDASLVLAVLLGLEDVHRASARQLEAMPALEEEKVRVRWPGPEPIGDERSRAAGSASANTGPGELRWTKRATLDEGDASRAEAACQEETAAA